MSRGTLPGTGAERLLLRLSDALGQLHIFLLLSRCGLQTDQVGHYLGRTSAAITHSVKSLESLVGAPLIERARFGMQMTDLGSTVVQRARRVEEELEAGLREIESERPYSASFNRLTVHSLHDVGRLKLLIALKNSSTISGAAEKLNLTQSGTSMALRRLEARLGFQLFERSARGVVAGEAVEMLTYRAERVFAELRHLASDIVSNARSVCGDVIVAASPSVRSRVLPAAITEVMTTHPGIRITTVDEHYDRLTARLIAGSIDIGAAVPRGDCTRDLIVKPLFEDRLVFVTRTDHPARENPQISPEALLRNWPLVLPQAASPSRRLLNSMISEHGISPRSVRLESADLGTIRHVLLESNSIAFVSRDQFCFELRAGVLAELHTSLPPLARKVALLTRRGAVLSRPVEIFAEALRSMSSTRATTKPRLPGFFS